MWINANNQTLDIFITANKLFFDCHYSHFVCAQNTNVRCICDILCVKSIRINCVGWTVLVFEMCFSNGKCIKNMFCLFSFVHREPETGNLKWKIYMLLIIIICNVLNYTLYVISLNVVNAENPHRKIIFLRNEESALE